MTAEAATPTKKVNCAMYRPQRDVAAEAGDGQAVLELAQVAGSPGRDQQQKESDPHPVPAAAYHRFFKHEHGSHTK